MRVQPGAVLNVGDIVYQDMDRKDGLILNRAMMTGLSISSL